MRNFVSLMLGRRIPLRVKFIFVGFVGGYILLPTDLVRDFFVPFGYVDDGADLVAAVSAFNRYAENIRAKMDKGKEVGEAVY